MKVTKAIKISGSFVPAEERPSLYGVD